jgi:hypothetical protein
VIAVAEKLVKPKSTVRPHARPTTTKVMPKIAMSAALSLSPTAVAGEPLKPKAMVRPHARPTNSGLMPKITMSAALFFPELRSTALYASRIVRGCGLHGAVPKRPRHFFCCCVVQMHPRRTRTGMSTKNQTTLLRECRQQIASLKHMIAHYELSIAVLSTRLTQAENDLRHYRGAMEFACHSGEAMGEGIVDGQH